MHESLKMFRSILIIVFSTSTLYAWSGILMDGSRNGKTQLYVPGNPPVNTPNVDLGLPHFYCQAVVLFNGKAYFIGGGNGFPSEITNAVTIFDPATNRSTLGVPMNSARYLHAATVVNDTILVCGGWNESAIIAECEQFNDATQTWNVIAPLPAPIYSFSMLTLHNRVYSFGRNCLDDLPRAVCMFDGQNWINKTALADGSVCDHAGVALDTDRALICGGLAFINGSSHYVPDCQIYSASSDSWTKVAPMAQIRGGHEMVLYGDEIFILGDVSTDGTTVESYSPSTGGTILSTRIVYDAWMAIVPIGMTNGSTHQGTKSVDIIL